MNGKVKVKIDKMKCAGSTICVMEQPGVFQLDDEMQAKVIDAQGATRDEIIAAAGACPMSAIIVEDAETGEKLFE